MSLMIRDEKRVEALTDRLMELAEVGDDAVEKAREMAEDIRDGEYSLEYAVERLKELF